MMAGATAVAVDTANFYEPQTALHVIAGIREFLEKKTTPCVKSPAASGRGSQIHRPEGNRFSLQTSIHAISWPWF